MNTHMIIYLLQDMLLRFQTAYAGPIIFTTIFSNMNKNSIAYSSIIVSSIIIFTSSIFNKYDKVLYKYFMWYVFVDIISLITIIGLRLTNRVTNDLYYILINAEVATTVMLIVMSINIKKSYFKQEMRKKLDNYSIVTGQIAVLLGATLSILLPPSLTFAFILMAVFLIFDNILGAFFIKLPLKE